jgi:hypothetical protein
MLCATQVALAQSVDTILLDFETATTGSEILSEPLVKPQGTITASTTGGTLYVQPGNLGTGLFLLHDQADETSDESGQLEFDFDVSSITFNYGGFSAGEFVGEVLDADLNVLDTFFDPDTSGGELRGPVTLSGQGIRYFRFRDTDPNRVTVGVDNVAISPGVSVPDQIDAVLGMIEDLEVAGTLGGGIGNALSVKLDAARNQANHQSQAAVGQLGAFINQVMSLMRRGVLTAAEGQALVDAAQDIIASLGG